MAMKTGAHDDGRRAVDSRMTYLGTALYTGT